MPLLYFFYDLPEWTGVIVAPGLETAVAHATSLFVIVPTALRGAITYHRSGRVVWSAAVPIGAAAVVGAVVGARLAVALPGAALRLGFGLVLVASAVQLVRGRTVAGRRGPRLSPPVTIASGTVIGLLSAMLGIGGGIVAIPALIYLVGLELEQVAATSLAIIVFAATAGALTYVGAGWGRPGLPSGSFGYVHVAAALPIVLGSLMAVRWGTRVNERLGTRALRWLFAGLFFVLGVRLIVANAGFIA